jgi:AcrR family transcriptional regulator
MGRRSDHTKEELSNLIVDTAFEIIKDKGYNAVSARKIADKIGYTVGTLYNTFANLDEILLHVSNRILDMLMEKLAESVKSMSNPEERLYNFAHEYIEFSQNNFNLCAMLFEYRFPESQQIPDWYSSTIDRIYNLIGDNLHEIAPNKSYEEIRMLTSGLWAAVHGMCTLSMKGKLHRTRITSINAVVDMLIDTIMRGLK